MSHKLEVGERRSLASHYTLTTVSHLTPLPPLYSYNLSGGIKMRILLLLLTSSSSSFVIVLFFFLFFFFFYLVCKCHCIVSCIGLFMHVCCLNFNKVLVSVSVIIIIIIIIMIIIIIINRTSKLPGTVAAGRCCTEIRFFSF